MKNILNQLTACFLICASVLLCVSCSDDKKVDAASKKADIQVAELLQRNEKIQLGKEWDFAQNFYSDQKKALEKDPNNGEARLKLAQLFIKEARITGEHGHYYNAALDQLNTTLKNNKEDKDLVFRTLVTKAGVQLSHHKFKDALKSGVEALALNGQNAQIHGVLVDANVELGNYEKAVAHGDKMISIKPDIRSYSRISYLREIHGDIEGAIEAMRLAVESGFPGYEETAWAMQTMGEMLLKYGRLDDAEKVFNEILLTRENYPFAVGALGEVYMERGELERAEKKIQEAIDIIPEVGFYVQMAELYKITGRKAEFDKIIEEIFVMLKDDVDSGHVMNMEYAYLYLDVIGDLDKASEYAKIEFDKRPKNIDTNLLTALIAYAKGDVEKCKPLVDAASVTGSKDPSLLDLKEKLLK